MRWLIDILAFLEARFIHKDMNTLPKRLHPRVDHSACATVIERKVRVVATPRIHGVSVRPYTRRERELMGNPEAQAVRHALARRDYEEKTL